jgi:hypothetical protein
VVGRAFLTSEDTAGAPHVAGLSHRFRASHFNANPKSVGRTVTLNGERYTIVGMLSEKIALVATYVPGAPAISIRCSRCGTSKEDATRRSAKASRYDWVSLGRPTRPT